MDRHGGLRDDRSAVELAGDEVHRHAGDLHAVRQRLLRRVHAWERRQQRRMDVENRVGIRVEERLAEQPHESRQADERDAMRVELRDEGALEELARRERAVIDRHCGNPGRLRAREPCASGRLEMTTAISARSRPSTVASMSA